MPQQRTNERNVQREQQTDARQVTRRIAHQVQEAESNMMEHWTEYARQNPGSAALMCLGVGFILGWKLKPW